MPVFKLAYRLMTNDQLKRHIDEWADKVAERYSRLAARKYGLPKEERQLEEWYARDFIRDKYKCLHDGTRYTLPSSVPVNLNGSVALVCSNDGWCL